MALSLNRARVATQRELAIGWWGLDRVRKEWASYWMRARVRYRLKAAREIERQRLAGGALATHGG